MMTPRQQGIFRTLVKRAWEKAVAAHGWKFANATQERAAKDAWYRSQLHDELGVFTTKQLSAHDDYAKLCAVFEALVGDSIYWQLRAHGGKDAEQRRRLLHAIKDLCAQHDLDENYARGIARQSLKAESTPLLDTLSPGQLLAVLQALKMHVRRERSAA
jgi:hypothetical protein